MREGYSLINYFMTDFTAILSATCTNRIIPHYTLDFEGIVGYNSA